MERIERLNIQSVLHFQRQRLLQLAFLVLGERFHHLIHIPQIIYPVRYALLHFHSQALHDPRTTAARHVLLVVIAEVHCIYLLLYILTYGSRYPRIAQRQIALLAVVKDEDTALLGLLRHHDIAHLTSLAQ